LEIFEVFFNEVEFEFNLEGFLKKNVWFPPVKWCQGVPFFLGGLNKETRRCFLRCLQVSSSSSLLFNIVYGSAIKIASFSLRHRSHARPPLENAWPLALIDQLTYQGDSLSFNFQMYEDNVAWLYFMFLKDVLSTLHLFLNSFSVNP